MAIENSPLEGWERGVQAFLEQTALYINEDKNIPENIQNVFLNYLLILNLIKKQIVYYKNTVKKVEEIANNMEKHTISRKMTVKSHDKLYMIQEQEKGIESYLSNLID
mgnify:CR=1 FL=1